jgi:ArsR family transcriptional regulator, arsenate/arsenite/antimonite-responsive transcriptional repressor
LTNSQYIDNFRYIIMKTIEDDIVKISKALSDKTRLRILKEIVKKGSISCGDAEAIAELSQPTVSHHLKILTEAGLLAGVKDGRHVIITVNKDALRKFSELLIDNIKV